MKENLVQSSENNIIKHSGEVTSGFENIKNNIIELIKIRNNLLENLDQLAP